MKKTIILTIIILTAIALMINQLNNIFVVAPREQKLNQELKIMNIKDEYAQCKIWAEDDYDHSWNTSCFNLGLNEDCMLDQDVGEIYNKSLEKKRNTCLEVYKTDMEAI